MPDGAACKSKFDKNKMKKWLWHTSTHNKLLFIYSNFEWIHLSSTNISSLAHIDFNSFYLSSAYLFVSLRINYTLSSDISDHNYQSFSTLVYLIVFSAASSSCLADSHFLVHTSSICRQSTIWMKSPNISIFTVQFFHAHWNWFDNSCEYFWIQS